MTRPGAAAPDVLVLTRDHDFHAAVIADALRRRGLSAAVVEANGLAGRGGLSWHLEYDGAPALVCDVDGTPVPVRDVPLIWWRRLTGQPQLPDGVHPDAQDLVGRDCRASLLGLVATEFRGVYVSEPEATRAAENKLVQLRAARQAGLAVPATIVSSDPDAVGRFFAEHGEQVVVKTVAGSPGHPVMTGRVTADLLRDDAVTLSPAIYQEYVPGNRHLRVNVFGPRVHTALLETERLDWRYPLDCSARPYTLDEDTTTRLHRVLDLLGLRMGVFDLKLTPDDDLVWLEVNPQGQFLWLEGLCQMSLTDAFTDFLVDELHAARHQLG